MAPSKSKQKRQAAAAAAAANGNGNSNGSSNGNSNGNGNGNGNHEVDGIAEKRIGGGGEEKVYDEDMSVSSSSMSLHSGAGASKDCTVTGVFTSRKGSRDIKFESFFMNFKGKELISDATLELNFGRRYGLIGANGCGKSSFLGCLADREIPIPSHIDIYLLREEVDPTERSALQTVIDSAIAEQVRLEKEAEVLLAEEGPDSDNLQDVYDRLDKLDPSTFESRAGELLHGLGFSQKAMDKKTKDMSGGWRMRVALAKALFIQPTLLLLDEPTNHLDLEACVWLEEYLKNYDRILVVISHSQDFLNGVCTNIINFRRQKLYNYTGNYDTYIKTREELEANQMKQYTKQQEDIAHIKQFIASCGTYSNLVRQGKSKQKILDKMEADGLIEKVVADPIFSFQFPLCGKLPPPVLSFNDVSFSYSGKEEDFLYTHLDFGVDLDSRIALVGPNGAGKSTLLKLMCQELIPTLGQVSAHTHLRIGRYHQHFVNQLDLTKAPLDYIRDKFSDMKLEEEAWRSKLGRFGITGSLQKQTISTLSDGQKSRIVFAEIALKNPHLLLLDEPTNHLDMECIDALAGAINEFDGGLVLVSHDFRLINQVAKEIWVCDQLTVKKWNGDIQSYKAKLKQAFNKKK